MADKGHTDNRALRNAAIRRFCGGIAILGLFLFLCAGSVRYWNGWLFLAAIGVAILLFGIGLYRGDKELLKKRLNTKEKEPAQRAYVVTTGIAFLATFGVSGLDYRFGWSRVPLPVVLIALCAMLAGFGLFVVTLRQNRFASRVVEIQDRQKVIDTGVYSIVRHPMYTAALIMFLSAPLVLGSYYALIPMLVYPIGIVLRIRNEEQVLAEGLEGYEAYRRKVRYRLIPFVW